MTAKKVRIVTKRRIQIVYFVMP